MMPPPSTTGEAQPQPVELSGPAIQHLRDASRWTRFLAIALFIATGALALAIVGIIVAARGAIPPGTIGVTRTIIPAVISLASTSTAATLLWLYGRDVVAFFKRGEPSLTQAFRKLRLFFKLWTLYVVLSIATDILALLGKL